MVNLILDVLLSDSNFKMLPEEWWRHDAVQEESNIRSSIIWSITRSFEVFFGSDYSITVKDLLTLWEDCSRTPFKEISQEACNRSGSYYRRMELCWIGMVRYVTLLLVNHSFFLLCLFQASPVVHQLDHFSDELMAIAEQPSSPQTLFPDLKVTAEELKKENRSHDLLWQVIQSTRCLFDCRSSVSFS